jgi:hypothetical protein
MVGEGSPSAGQRRTVGSLTRAVRVAIVLAVATFIFEFSWLFRFNDPGGAFAGLTDDHFFYLVRGWQILFGDLPVRDFVDHGAPLYFYTAAAVQLFERGTLSELTFSVTTLSITAALTFLLSTRASGSIVCGVLATTVQVLLEPRLYNYPKLLVYAVAIPCLWRFADRPGAGPRFAVALATAIGFLFRHDHGPFVAAAFAVLLVCLTELPWQRRVRHALLFGATTLALLSPYLLFVEVNGGVARYFREASAWAARDRDRAPIVWPGLFDQTSTQASSAAASSAIPGVQVVGDNLVAWMYYLELALPVVALGALAMSRDGFRPGWHRAIPKLASVAVLGAVLNAGFLRHPLEARLADPFVPHAILLAWLWAAALRAMKPGSIRPRLERWAAPVRAALVVAALASAFIPWVGLGRTLPARLERTYLSNGPTEAFERADRMRSQLRAEWELASWEHREDRPDLIGLSLYLNACTEPDDRIFIQPYAPQVLAIARRGFAGGHADLRPGFFSTTEAQQLIVERLRRQRPPVVLLEVGESYDGFRSSFPLVTAYFDEQYVRRGTWMFDQRFGIQLFIRRDAKPMATYASLGWPCVTAGGAGPSTRAW